jgi:hypothetical protein
VGPVIEGPVGPVTEGPVGPVTEGPVGPVILSPESQYKFPVPSLRKKSPLFPTFGGK